MIFGSYKNETHHFIVLFGIKFRFLRKQARRRLKDMKKLIQSPAGTELFRSAKYLSTLNVSTLRIMNKLAQIEQLPRINRTEAEYKAKRLRHKGTTDSSREKRIIINVSLTPERVGDTHLALYSLLVQTLKPDKLILWINEEDFPDKAALPETILTLQDYGLEIKFCLHKGTANALSAACLEYPADIHVTASDYLFYPVDWLSDLYRAHDMFTDCIIAHKTITPVTLLKELLPPNTEVNNVKPLISAYHQIAINEEGALYPPCVCKHIAAYRDNAFSQKRAEANSQLWATCVNARIKTVCTPAPTPVQYIDSSRDFTESTENAMHSNEIEESYRLENSGWEKILLSEYTSTDYFTGFGNLAKKIAHEAKQNGRKIKVAFMMWEPSFWKSELLFKAMEQHPLFEPAFWMTNMGAVKDKSILCKKRAAAIDYAQKHNHIFFESSTYLELRNDFNPDYIFIAQPYISYSPFKLHELKYEIPCYIPYYCDSITAPHAYSGKYVQDYYRFYLESQKIHDEVIKFMPNKGKNTKVTGLPIVAQLQTKISEPAWPETADGKKKIIWAPHWTIGGRGPQFSVSNFLEIADKMLSLAEQFKDEIFIAFKPHPRLIKELYEIKGWGKERADAYYSSWKNGYNTCLQEGDYIALFQQSDAMIHDCGSFLLEYMLINKPCMYLIRKDARVQFNATAKQALQAYRKGTKIQEIEQFVIDVIKENDDSAEKRKQFIEEYLTDTYSPIDNIINDILDL